MIRPVVRDPIRLGVPSTPATFADLPAAQDLRDTLNANRAHCVGMAANMIGVHKCIIAIDFAGDVLLMLNPAILTKKGVYQTTEGCLSLPGQRTATRYREITVKYQDTHFVWHTRAFAGFPAQIIQHEIDHCNGVLI